MKETYGVILYQEQVQQAAAILADFSMGQGDILRRAMGKKMPEEMNRPVSYTHLDVYKRQGQRGERVNRKGVGDAFIIIWYSFVVQGKACVMKKFLMVLVVAGCAGVAARAGLPEELAAEVKLAQARGVAWVLAQQQHNGYWGSPEAPAMTALAMQALNQTAPETALAAINRAMVFILTNVHPDGSIWREPSMARRGGGLANYNTAICMTALHDLKRPELVPVVQNARAYLAKVQYLDGGNYHGGMGYDAETDRAYADLSNSYMAYEAMRLTQDVEDLRASGEARADLDWAAARQFLAQVQLSLIHI